MALWGGKIRSNKIVHVMVYLESLLSTGAKEAEEAPNRHSEMISALMDEVRKQIGVVYACD